MFTNEFNPEESVTTVLDETATFADVELIIGDDGVYIRQFSKDDGTADLIMLSHKMFRDMLQAMNHTEGFFITKYNQDP